MLGARGAQEPRSRAAPDIEPGSTCGYADGSDGSAADRPGGPWGRVHGLATAPPPSLPRVPGTPAQGQGRWAALSPSHRFSRTPCFGFFYVCVRLPVCACAWVCVTVRVCSCVRECACERMCVCALRVGMCERACLCVCMPTHVHVCLCVLTCVRVRVSACGCVPECARVHMCVCTTACVHVRLCVYQGCVHTRVH